MKTATHTPESNNSLPPVTPPLADNALLNPFDLGLEIDKTLALVTEKKARIAALRNQWEEKKREANAFKHQIASKRSLISDWTREQAEYDQIQAERRKNNAEPLLDFHSVWVQRHECPEPPLASEVDEQAEQIEFYELAATQAFGEWALALANHAGVDVETVRLSTLQPGQVMSEGGTSHRMLREQVVSAHSSVVRGCKLAEGGPVAIVALDAARCIETLEKHMSALKAEQWQLQQWITANLLDSRLLEARNRLDGLAIAIDQAELQLVMFKIVHCRANRQYPDALEQQAEEIRARLQSRGQSQELRAMPKNPPHQGYGPVQGIANMW